MNNYCDVEKLQAERNKLWEEYLFDKKKRESDKEYCKKKELERFNTFLSVYGDACIEYGRAKQKIAGVSSDSCEKLYDDIIRSKADVDEKEKFILDLAKKMIDNIVDCTLS